MELRCACCYFLTTVAVGVSFFPNSVIAQISSDGTLSTTVSTDDAVNFLIEGGERSLNNLFHSFSEFSIPNLGEAYFNNATDITNIFSRVTGGNISDIQGLIRANGTANLFLINPAGIVFGENASLDVGGSFFATTAENVVFEDDIEFSAIEPQEAPLLTVSITPGLQMGANSGSITVQGNGHSLASENPIFTPFLPTDIHTGLGVKPGNTLALIARGISVNGGILTAPEGNIEIGSVSNGTVDLQFSPQGTQLDYQGVSSFEDITLTQAALVDVNGANAGSIQVQGNQINIRDGSVLWWQNRGDKIGGIVSVNASGSLTLSNTGQNITVPSAIITETLGGAAAGYITIVAPQLIIRSGGNVSSRTYSPALSGNVSIEAQTLEIAGYSPISPDLYSFLGTTNLNSGDAGNISVAVENLSVLDGGYFGSSALSTGQGGEVKVDADTIVVSGATSSFIPSIIAGTTVGRGGDAGSVTVNTRTLRVQNSGIVASSSIGVGSAGDLTVNASESIEIIGSGSGNVFGNVIASTVDFPPPVYREIFGLSGIPRGAAGSININTPLLKLSNYGAVSSANFGVGNGGDVNINAGTIQLRNGGSIGAFTSFGQGGNIYLNVENSLLLRDETSVSAEVTERFISNQSNQLSLNGSNITQSFVSNESSLNGGNITINANLVALLEASQINANAFEGNGGNITITTQGLFVSPNSSITASSQFGVDGTITLNTPDEENKLAIAELSADLTDTSQQIVGNCSWTRDNTFYVTGRSGIAKTPQEHIQDYTMWSDIRDLNQLSARRQEAESSRQERIVEANAWRINERGNVELVAVVPNNQNLGQVASSCSGDVNS